MTEKYLISVEDLAKRFPTPDGKGDTEVFGDLWFGVEEGEFVCLIGHSGCGKTTLLNILAGLDAASSGGVIVDGKEVSGTSLDRAVVFQHHALMPWMTACMPTLPLRWNRAGPNGRRPRCASNVKNISTWFT